MDFAVVYIEEAHASDEWPIYQVADIPQHKSIGDRLEVAQRYRRDFPCHPRLLFCADTFGNEFNRAYASWPFRFWVLERPCPQEPARVGFKAMPQDSCYRLEDLSDFLSLSTTPTYPCTEMGHTRT